MEFTFKSNQTRKEHASSEHSPAELHRRQLGLPVRYQTQKLGQELEKEVMSSELTSTPVMELEGLLRLVLEGDPAVWHQPVVLECEAD